MQILLHSTAKWPVPPRVNQNSIGAFSVMVPGVGLQVIIPGVKAGFGARDDVRAMLKRQLELVNGQIPAAEQQKASQLRELESERSTFEERRRRLDASESGLASERASLVATSRSSISEAVKWYKLAARRQDVFDAGFDPLALPRSVVSAGEDGWMTTNRCFIVWPTTVRHWPLKAFPHLKL